MEPVPQRVTQNRLLSALPEKDFRAILPFLERVRMKRGDIVYHPNAPINDLYFPETCIISSLTVFDDGASIESGIVGFEGMAGISLLLARSTASRETTVQTSGNSLRLKADKFRAIFESSEAMQQFVFNYAAVFFEQVAQVGACDNHHPVRERLARLLLMCDDRTKGHKVKITQDSIAQMLCVHRPSVTLAATSLKEDGLIDYVRGAITITDRRGLERSACECYESIAEGYKHYVSSLDPRSLGRRLMINAAWQNDNSANSDGIHASDETEEVPGEFSLCGKCHNNVADSRGRWQEISYFAGTRFSVVLRGDLCPNCSESAAQKAG